MAALSSAGDATASILIVGGGLAGLFCALKLGPRPVTVLAAAPIGEGASSAWAQGGIAAAMAEDDTFEKHLADTLVAGAGIVDEAVARLMVSEAPARVRDLLAYGVPFDRDLEGRLQLSREAAHSERRIVRVRGDMAGRAIMEALVAAVRATPSIRVVENIVAERLLIEDGAAAGVVARTIDGRRVTIAAGQVVLASGGIGNLYAVTTNPPEAHGAGLGMAAAAGALIADPEFVQFHPTALDVGRDPAPLATEALRGEGAVLVDRTGRRFMPDYHPDAELGPRDIVARGIFAEQAAGRGAFLDARAAVGAAFPERFPTVTASCRAAGIDPVTQPIPVVPAAHYHMGGVLTDADGRTSVPGLWACGEVASTGVHGANRLASNSLLEAVVFAARIAEALTDASDAAPATVRPPPEPLVAGADDAEAIRELRAVMSRDVGVIRDAGGLRRALRALAALARPPRGADFANRLIAARFVAVGALLREESRGGHFRSDRPEPVESWRRRTRLTLAEVDRVTTELAEEALT
ncbi:MULTISPECIES: L-aspartate oxidase [unclassified Aureimonas]|uniref:L-aspartate oxidase n=1 Tax=unclassified Aureimonas TaxID=2615206 RepID=UPI0006FDC8AF|nr:MULTISPECIES: L-aspartate oxidase [unclassified Aureimonas]KQT55315.1 L-aspartate oxidase [Aureimonas sp. Leaf427]KQT71106.1 L-aspartate oxidase [Aureimonas sp. Leaf460]